MYLYTRQNTDIMEKTSVRTTKKIDSTQHPSNGFHSFFSLDFATPNVFPLLPLPTEHFGENREILFTVYHIREKMTNDDNTLGFFSLQRILSSYTTRTLISAL